MPAQLNINTNQILELILQLSKEEKKVLFIELKKLSEFEYFLNDFLQIGSELSLSHEEITEEVEIFRKEQFVFKHYRISA